MQELQQTPAFVFLWDTFVTNLDEHYEAPVNYPYYFDRPGMGAFRVFPTALILPQKYYLREFIPVDDEAWEFCRRLRETGLPTVHVHAKFHWNLPEANGL